METFIASFIVGMIAAAMQHSNNISDMGMQNQYNERMWNLHSSPTARADELRMAGLSDSAIAQALTGYNGAGTTLNSAPMQPTDMMSHLYDLLGSANETKKTESDIKFNDASIEKMGIEAGYTGAQLKVYEATSKYLIERAGIENDFIKSSINKNESETKKIKAETDKISLDARYQEIENYIKENTADDEIKKIKNEIKQQNKNLELTDAQIESLLANAAYMYEQAEQINILDDVKEKEAAEAKFYEEFLKEFGVPYEVCKDVADTGVKVLESVIGMFGIKLSKITTLIKRAK